MVSCTRSSLSLLVLLLSGVHALVLTPAAPRAFASSGCVRAPCVRAAEDTAVSDEVAAAADGDATAEEAAPEGPQEGDFLMDASDVGDSWKMLCQLECDNKKILENESERTQRASKDRHKNPQGEW